jgi:DNA-3-methyladenine glycosylase II
VLLIDSAPVEFAVTQAARGSAPELDVVLSGTQVTRSTEAAAHSTLARLLGLELDLSDFYARSDRDRALKELVERYRGLKPPRFPTIFECLLNAVACQQLSLAAGLTLLSRLAARAGAPSGALHAFPAPTDVLALPRSTLQTIGFSERKSETILELADAAAAGELELSALDHLTDTAVVRKLVERRGIGPWSADYVLLRGLGRLHVFPRGDSGALGGVRRFLAAAGREDDPRTAVSQWAPDAGLVYFHLLLRGLEQHASRSGESTSRGNGS